MSFTIRLTKLKAWMEKKGIRRREDLAAATKLSIATVNKILCQRPVSQSTLTLLSHYTGIAEGDLLQSGEAHSIGEQRKAVGG